jgi:hypothetical protein
LAQNFFFAWEKNKKLKKKIGKRAKWTKWAK